MRLLSLQRGFPYTLHLLILFFFQQITMTPLVNESFFKGNTPTLLSRKSDRDFGQPNSSIFFVQPENKETKK